MRSSMMVKETFSGILYGRISFTVLYRREFISFSIRNTNLKENMKSALVPTVSADSDYFTAWICR